MAGVSMIGALSSLSEEDLYYQYLINNNSTSTMLNAVLGNDSDTSGNGMAGIVSSLYGNSALSGIGSLLGNLGNDGDMSALSSLTTFSEVLKTYTTSQTAEASQMVQTLSDTLQEAEEAGESNTLSYKTVQEIYQYFQDKTNAGALSSETGTAAKTAAATEKQASVLSPSFNELEEFDFDAFEEESEQWMDSLPGVSFNF